MCLFLGRDAELTRIAEARTRARVLVVYGLAGMGKTTLLRRALSSLRDAAACRVWITCEPGDRASSTLLKIGRAAFGDETTHNARQILARLGEEAESRELVIVIDDAGNLEDSGLSDLLASLATLPRITVALASRRRLLLVPSQIDHLALELGPLAADDNAALWRALEGLYGPRSAPEMLANLTPCR